MEINKEQVNAMIEQGQKRGLTGKNVIDALIRKGYTPEGVDVQAIKQSWQQKEMESMPKEKLSIGDRLREAAGDVQQTIQGIANTSQERADNITDLQTKRKAGERSLLGTTLKQAGQLAGAGADAIGEAFKGAVKLTLSQEKENQLKNDFTQLAQQVAKTDTAQWGMDKWNGFYEGLNDSQKEAVDAIGGVAALATEFIGTDVAKNVGKQALQRGQDVAEMGIKTGKEAFEQVQGSLKKQWDELIPGSVPKPEISTVGDALKAPEYGLTKDIAGVRAIGDESKFLTVPEKRKLLEISPEKGKEYIDTLLKSEDSFDNMTPFEKAVIDTEKVIAKYDKVVRNTGNKIGEIKNKLKTLSVAKSDVDEIVSGIADNLKAKGVAFTKGRFVPIKGINSPFSQADINALNKEIADTLKNIQKSKSMDNLLLGMERLDNKINFNVSSELTGDLQGVSKTVRAKLKNLRNKALTKEESELFEVFSDAKGFIDDFKKGNSENKIMSLLNVVGSKRDLKLKRIADEIKRVTGEDITDYAYLARILSEAAGSQSRNRSLLNQYIGEAVSMSPTGILSKAVEGVANKIINVDKLDEIRKAIEFTSKSIKQ